jgi:hypothetical protein
LSSTGSRTADGNVAADDRWRVALRLAEALDGVVFDGARAYDGAGQLVA